MENGKNISQTKIGQTVTIGRMKGNINVGDKIYKMSSKQLSIKAKESYQKENRKIPLNCHITIHKNEPISIQVTTANSVPIYKNLNICCKLDYIPLGPGI